MELEVFGERENGSGGIAEKWFRWSRRDESRGGGAVATGPDKTITTRALPKFVQCLTPREAPVLVDLGPVVGTNVAFFGERLGCKIFVEDIFTDIERHARENRLAELPAFLERRLPEALAKRIGHAEDSVDGILCWDVFDYLDKPSAQALGRALTRVLRPGGALFGFFATVVQPGTSFTRFSIVDEKTVHQRSYRASVARQAVKQNRDIYRLFDGTRVAESFLLLTHTRELLFRKPPSPATGAA